MPVLLAFMFLTNFLLHLCYEFECPNSSQWQLRSTAICNSSELYGCLYDKIQNKYTERCIMSPSIERIGRKNVFSGGIDRVRCELNRFQPFTFSTNGNDECVYAKSICSLEGQVVFYDGESDTDRSCTCDYTYGYAFVVEPATKCKCDPFIEDCTCYKKLCPPYHVLSPDYHCTAVDNWKGDTKCPILDATNTKKEEKQPDMPKVFLENDNKDSRKLLKRYMPSLIIILLFVSSSLVMVVQACIYRIHKQLYLDIETIRKMMDESIEEESRTNLEQENVCLCTDTNKKNLEAVHIREVIPKSSIDMSEEEEINCTDSLDNTEIHSKDKQLTKPYAHLHLNHSHLYSDLQRTSAEMRKMILAIKAPAYDLIKRQRSRTLKRWRDNSKVFVKTSIYDKVLACAKKTNCVLITGEDGNGITVIMQNVVLAFEEEGYEIYPITTPVYSKQLYSPLTKILFCVENVCGRYDCEYHDIQLWSSWEIYIKMMLEENNVKFIVSCRHRVLKDSQFQKLKLFHSCICDLSDDNYKCSENDIRLIAKMYNVKCISFIDNIYQVYKKTECFPLLCCLYYNINKKYNLDVTIKEFSLTPYSLLKSQLDELVKTGDFKKYCALALCVMFNNHLEEAFFIGEISDEIEHVITDTCKACGVPSFTTRKDLLIALKSFDDYVLKKENGVFSTVHDRLFDCLIFFFGHRIIKNIINHAQINVVMQRFIFKEHMAKSKEYKILIPEDVLQMYFERLLHEWSNREVINVFSNKNFIDETFQGTLTRHINDQRSKSKKEHLANEIAIELKETPLTMSCSKGYNIIVNWLINNNADVNECRYDGASPVLLACQEGNREVVTELITAGSDINRPDIDGIVPLYAACQYNHLKIVHILLDNGADPNSCIRQGISPLMISSENGNEDVVYKLLEKGAVVNYCSLSGISALFFACEKGHQLVAEYLLENGADVNLCTRDGSSPLYIAFQNGHLSTVNSLLNANVDTNKGSYSGATPLSISCQEGHVEIVETLIKHDANVNIYRYVSPLFTACEHGHLEVVKVLLQTDIDFDKCKFKSLTPLHISCQQGNTKIVEELLKKNADINACSAEGKSPLFIACQENQLQVVYLLLDMKETLDINKCTVDQRSPLFEACLRGNLEMVKVLVKYGADINIVDNEGHSALSVAPENKRYSIERLLKKKK